MAQRAFTLRAEIDRHTLGAMAVPETIRIEVAERVALITLNRPDRLNAYTVQMGIELFGALHELDLDDSVRAIVVTGAGRAFCAGADLGGGGTTFAGEQSWQAAAELEAKVRPWNMRTPVIAALNGAAVGIGATLPLQWDLRIASDRARIGFVFTRRGIIPEANSTWLLPRLVGTARALDLLITGRIIDAGEALSQGLVSRVVPHDRLLDEARSIALEIANTTSAVAVAITKRLVWRQLLEPDPVRAKASEDALFHWIGRQPDAAEGVVAFLEKREPRFVMSASSELPAEIADSL
jgi:enoyl-CoA hydratase/carnithine racemase